jgi:hypothetical protein
VSKHVFVARDGVKDFNLLQEPCSSHAFIVVPDCNASDLTHVAVPASLGQSSRLRNDWRNGVGRGNVVSKLLVE